MKFKWQYLPSKDTYQNMTCTAHVSVESLSLDTLEEVFVGGGCYWKCGMIWSRQVDVMTLPDKSNSVT